MHVIAGGFVVLLVFLGHGDAEGRGSPRGGEAGAGKPSLAVMLAWLTEAGEVGGGRAVVGLVLHVGRWRG